MKLKNLIRLIVLIPLSIYLLYCCYHFFTYPETQTYLDCGKVISKSNDEVTIKYGSKTELYLNVQFNKSGFQSVKCEPTTYFSKKVGDNVCFNLNKPVYFWHFLNYNIGFVVICTLIISLIILLVIYLFVD